MLKTERLGLAGEACLFLSGMAMIAAMLNALDFVARLGVAGWSLGACLGGMREPAVFGLPGTFFVWAIPLLVVAGVVLALAGYRLIDRASDGMTEEEAAKAREKGAKADKAAEKWGLVSAAALCLVMLGRSLALHDAFSATVFAAGVGLMGYFLLSGKKKASD